MKILSDKKGAVDASISEIILAVIAIVIAIALIPVIVASVNAVVPNLSGASLILIGLVTFIFIAGIIVLMIKKLFK